MNAAAQDTLFLAGSTLAWVVPVPVGLIIDRLQGRGYCHCCAFCPNCSCAGCVHQSKRRK